MLSIAGREAQIVGINPSLKAGYIGPEVAATVTAEHYARRVQWVREAAGDRFDDIELQVLTFLCRLTNDRDGEAARLAPLFGLSPEAALEAPLALVGDIDQLCDTLVERRERYGFSYWVFHDDEIDDFAPLVERLAGT